MNEQRLGAAREIDREGADIGHEPDTPVARNVVRVAIVVARHPGPLTEAA